MARGKILYPLAFLGFEIVQLQSWQELPDKLLQLAEEIDRDPQVWASAIPSASEVLIPCQLHPDVPAIHAITLQLSFGKADQPLLSSGGYSRKRCSRNQFGAVNISRC